MWARPARERVALAALAAGALLLVTGCETTRPAPEEAPQPVTRKAGKPLGGGGKPATEIRPVERPDIGALDLSAARKDAAAALTDPASLLSKRSIYFDYDRFDIKEQYRPVLLAHARYLREHPEARVLIQGNADERGSREYNLALGQKRSHSVRRILVLLGANEAQIEAVSVGEEKPLCTEYGEPCWSKNRRGDILYGSEL